MFSVYETFCLYCNPSLVGRSGVLQHINIGIDIMNKYAMKLVRM